MTPEQRCVVDRTQPCHACSAADPEHCPYLYLLGWAGEPAATPPGEPVRRGSVAVVTSDDPAVA